MSGCCIRSSNVFSPLSALSAAIPPEVQYTSQGTSENAKRAEGGVWRSIDPPAQAPQMPGGCLSDSPATPWTVFSEGIRWGDKLLERKSTLVLKQV